jgi:hypothetical protein
LFWGLTFFPADNAAVFFKFFGYGGQFDKFRRMPPYCAGFQRGLAGLLFGHLGNARRMSYGGSKRRLSQPTRGWRTSSHTAFYKAGGEHRKSFEREVLDKMQRGFLKTGFFHI